MSSSITTHNRIDSLGQIREDNIKYVPRKYKVDGANLENSIYNMNEVDEYNDDMGYLDQYNFNHRLNKIHVTTRNQLDYYHDNYNTTAEKQTTMPSIKKTHPNEENESVQIFKQQPQGNRPIKENAQSVLSIIARSPVIIKDDTIILR